MRAIRVHRFGDPDVMQLEEVTRPEPGGAEALVRVYAAGVNPVDTYIRSGHYEQRASLPYTPGIDAAGIVEAVGPDASVKPGDRVYTSGTVSGTYAELALCHGGQVHPLPSHISFAQGAALGIPYATAYRALFQRAHARPGDVVLVHGASGGVGIAAVQMARAAGMTVIGTAGSPRGQDLVLQQGAHHVLDHTGNDYPDGLRRLTEGRGADVILEMLANVNLAKDLAMLAFDGRIVVIGSRGTVQLDPRDAMVKEAVILGMLLFNMPDADRQRLHAALYAGLENGSLRPVIGQEMPLADAPIAHRRVMEPGSFGKIILIP